jgi:hypothetical protein
LQGVGFFVESREEDRKTLALRGYERESVIAFDGGRDERSGVREVAGWTGGNGGGV